MNVIVFASRKGGAGKSTLTAHLAAQVHQRSHPALLIDCDPQGSLTPWHMMRGNSGPPLRSLTAAVADLLREARRAGYEWVLIDTPSNMCAAVIRCARCTSLLCG